MRHGFTIEYDPRPGVSIASLAYDYSPDYRVPKHAHGSGQAIYASGGVMEVSAGQRVWLIPPQFAIWIPPRTLHRIRMAGSVSMRTLYLRPGLAPRLPSSCRVLHVTPLLRELILETVRVVELRASNRLHRALQDLLVFHLQAAAEMPITLAMPCDPRALRVAQALLRDKTASPPLNVLCAEAGGGVRTVQRAFRRDVGVTFETWRTQARLMKAVELLAVGVPMKQAAFELGYRQPGAFVRMFRRTLGITPKAWARGLPANQSAYSPAQNGTSPMSKELRNHLGRGSSCPPQSRAHCS
jgi:AraC-like DNA-binding protein